MEEAVSVSSEAWQSGKQGVLQVMNLPWAKGEEGLLSLTLLCTPPHSIIPAAFVALLPRNKDPIPTFRLKISS